MNKDIDKFLKSEEKGSTEVKFNIFKFQDHLLEWISLSARYFMERNYSSSFEALTIVYTDSFGFYDEPIQTKLDTLFDECLQHNSKFTNYYREYQNKKSQMAQIAFAPPMDIYSSILKLRKTLMIEMAKKQLLIPQLRKGIGGAGSG